MDMCVCMKKIELCDFRLANRDKSNIRDMRKKEKKVKKPKTEKIATTSHRLRWRQAVWMLKCRKKRT